MTTNATSEDPASVSLNGPFEVCAFCAVVAAHAEGADPNREEVFRLGIEDLAQENDWTRVHIVLISVKEDDEPKSVTGCVVCHGYHFGYRWNALLVGVPFPPPDPD